MYCPNCGREYENSQNFCRFCGYNLQGYQSPSTESPSLNTQPMENNQYQQDYQQQSYQEQNSQVAYKQEDNQQYQQPEYQEAQPEVQEQEQQVQAEEVEQQEVPNFDIEKLKNIKLTTNQKIVIAIIAILLACFAGLLWSINVETQIFPSDTEVNENFEMNVPSDDDRTYTKSPEKTEEAETSEQAAEQTDSTYAEQPTPQAEPPVLEAPIPAPEPIKVAEPSEYTKAPDLYQVPQHEVTTAPANPAE